MYPSTRTTIFKEPRAYSRRCYGFFNSAILVVSFCFQNNFHVPHAFCIGLLYLQINLVSFRYFIPHKCWCLFFLNLYTYIYMQCTHNLNVPPLFALEAACRNRRIVYLASMCLLRVVLVVQLLDGHAHLLDQSLHALELARRVGQILKVNHIADAHRPAGTGR